VERRWLDPESGDAPWPSRLENLVSQLPLPARGLPLALPLFGESALEREEEGTLLSTQKGHKFQNLSLAEGGLGSAYPDSAHYPLSRLCTSQIPVSNRGNKGDGEEARTESRGRGVVLWP